MPPIDLNLPQVLRPGDTLGIVAPASPFDRQSFDAGVEALESMGFRLLVPPEIFARHGYLAGSDRSRADLLQRMFVDPAVHGIICARGGYGAMRILPLLEAEIIARHPKVFVGFSDVTALLVFLVDHCGMAAFHGPTVTTLGNGDAASREQLLSLMTETSPPTMAAEAPVVVAAGQASGRFYCGNLTLFCHLTGTPFEPDFDGAVLLLEDQGEAPYRIDRMLTQMRLAGCFDTLSGLALGRFSGCGSQEAVHQIVAERMGDLGIPILGGFSVGHAGANHTLPVGIPAHLDTATGTLAFSGSVRD